MTSLNIQSPWSFLLINGDKSVETRSYPLPKKYEGVELALVETPGKYGKFKARIIGTITFSHSFRYESKQGWINDYNRHKVEDGDEFCGWKHNKDKFGWVVSQINKFDNHISAPKKKGIVFTKNCTVPVDKRRQYGTIVTYLLGQNFMNNQSRYPSFKEYLHAIADYISMEYGDIESDQQLSDDEKFTIKTIAMAQYDMGDNASNAANIIMNFLNSSRNWMKENIND